MMNSTFSYNHGASSALLTDLYQVTMAYGYWKNGLHTHEAVFHQFFRRPPFKGGFTIAAGLEQAIAYLENYRFQEDDLQYLASLKGADGKALFCEPFFDYLRNLRFSCDIDAVPEGSLVFPYEPILRVQGPIIQAQLLETPLLNLLNFATLIATKSARVCIAAQGDPVLEFGLRRAQGVNGALTASRSAYIGGCESTSNVLAGKLFGIPVRGTHSHSWVMIFDEEFEAFKAFAHAQPANCVFLVDTYNSLEGVKKAIEAGKWLVEQGKRMVGIRLDSGDLAYLSKKSRELLDEAGFTDAKIVASNELDESVISDLKRQGAQISIWGVGTNLVTAKDQPALDGVYKLSAVRPEGGDWKYRLKLSEQMTKISNPGILQVRRYYDSEKIAVADAIYDMATGVDEKCQIVDPLDPTRHKLIANSTSYRDLLLPIFRKGECVYAQPSLSEIRAYAQQELASFHEGVKRFLNPHQYVVGMESALYQKKVQLIQDIRNSFEKKEV